MTRKSTIRDAEAVVHHMTHRVMFVCSRALLKILVSIVCTGLLATTQASADDDFSYNVSVLGIEHEALRPVRDTFKAASLLEAKHSEPLVSIASLRGYLKSDVSLINRILRSYGYYNGRVDQRQTRQGNHFEIEIRITPGPLYVFDAVKVEYKGLAPEEDIRAKIDKKLLLEKGAPAVAEAVVLAEERVYQAFSEYGFPFATKIDRDLVVDHRNQSMNVTLVFETGARRQMGAVHIKGLTSVKENYLHKFFSWSQGDYYTSKMLDDLRARLSKSGLFSSIGIDAIPAEDDRVDIVITLAEAKHRTLGVMGSYSTAEGVGSELSWGHRNLFNRGDRLKLTARVAEIEQSLVTRFEIPTFFHLDQTLSIEAAVRRQNTTIYDAKLVEARVGIERVVTPHLALFARGEFEYSDITDNQVNRHYILAALPIGARWDNSDDLLDPSRGLRASLTVAPAASVGSTHFSFLKSEFRASAYYPVMSDERLVLAARTRLGSILGAMHEILPATRRFYAGGGGSIRGFAFQRVGPLDIENIPLGGRSVAEITLEVRAKASSTIGIVPFIEGGNVYETKFPQLSGFRWSVGLGARYHTSFAPIRFDIAFPLDRRPGESRMQFYISLGQAF